ncbi:MAG: hypothetical protein GC204_08955 [Chloroflexi bacterium]|nr:hypothetical protein [Chloroflexota bacterium]
MAISEVIRGVLADDVTLAALLVGGIYRYEDTGRSGISRVTTPDAYEVDGFLRACAVIKASEIRSAAAIRDSAAGGRQAVSVYLYDDGDNGYGTVLTARDLIVTLLDRLWIDGAGFVRRIGGAEDERDPKLNNAALVRIDFEIVG